MTAPELTEEQKEIVTNLVSEAFADLPTRSLTTKSFHTECKNYPLLAQTIITHS